MKENGSHTCMLCRLPDTVMDPHHLTQCVALKDNNKLAEIWQHYIGMPEGEWFSHHQPDAIGEEEEEEEDSKETTSFIIIHITCFTQLSMSSAAPQICMALSTNLPVMGLLCRPIHDLFICFQAPYCIIRSILFFCNHNQMLPYC